MSTILIRNECNQRCLHCSNPYLLEKGIVKRTEESEIIRRINADKGEECMLFTGEGEPTMHKGLPKFIALAKSLGVKRVGVESNGVLFSYEPYVQMLKKAGMDYAIISLNSHKAKISDHITQAPGTFDHTIKGVSILRRNGIDIPNCMHTISSYNYNDLKGFLLFAYLNLGIKTIHISYIRPLEYDTDALDKTPRFEDAMKPLYEGFIYAKRNDITLSICPAMGIPLCYLDGFENLSHELVVYSSSNKEEFHRICHAEHKIKGEKCKDCTLSPACCGVTKGYALLYGTDSLIPSKKDLDKLVNHIRK